MLIRIDASAANDADAHQWLDRILYKVEDGWHVWDTEIEPEPSEIETTSWVLERAGQGEWVRELFAASVQRSAWSLRPHGRCVQVTAQPNGADQLTPEDAVRLAEEPMVILVENRDSDGSFVKRIIAELDRSLNRVWHQTGDPIRFDSLGGAGQMCNEIDRRNRAVSYRPRLVAIIDSDRKGPDDLESDSARKLKRKCESLGVPCWVLAKREAENYLPRALLVERPDAGVDHARMIEVWDRLSDAQKDFFDMKDGLPEALSETELELFEGVSRADRAVLTRGFGPNVYACWNIWSVQVRSELRTRGLGDLERGIALIRKEA